MRTFFTETHLWPIKHISEYKHVFGRANSSSSILVGQIHTVKVNNICNITLWVRFYRPTKCTHGPAEDPFEAVMCAVGAASQISECLWRILF